MKPEQSEKLLEAFVLSGLAHEIAQKLWEEHFSQPNMGYDYEHVYFGVKFYFTHIIERLFSPDNFESYAFGPSYNFDPPTHWDNAFGKARNDETC